MEAQIECLGSGRGCPAIHWVVWHDVWSWLLTWESGCRQEKGSGRRMWRLSGGLGGTVAHHWHGTDNWSARLGRGRGWHRGRAQPHHYFHPAAQLNSSTSGGLNKNSKSVKLPRTPPSDAPQRLYLRSGKSKKRVTDVKLFFNTVGSIRPFTMLRETSKVVFSRVWFPIWRESWNKWSCWSEILPTLAKGKKAEQGKMRRVDGTKLFFANSSLVWSLCGRKYISFNILKDSWHQASSGMIWREDFHRTITSCSGP